ncbi:hypothetical protein Ppa06_25700 [Planomonospora parontospora subsp. parontospora]|uniref:AAA domain-containing protein n=2 Tax=Planomonospora parontospora TaxID=58119 RepID=A0AA37BEK3_9ACTN|nr:hypothetical protein GCM10010126_19980 [Planomonospora parontospora]GII08772.1 hypothetical protein Ppa06_25700 [Planomonospora parontospora subsp. parontospora]
MEKPPSVFARDFEWSLLDRFMGPYPGLHLSVMCGRRRQGKSFVLSHLSEAFQGMYHMALPDDDRLLALERFGTTLGEWAGWPTPRPPSTSTPSSGARPATGAASRGGSRRRPPPTWRDG